MTWICTNHQAKAKIKIKVNILEVILVIGYTDALTEHFDSIMRSVEMLSQKYLPNQSESILKSNVNICNTSNMSSPKIE